MEHIFAFTTGGQAQDHERPQAVRLDTGELSSVTAAGKEDGGELNLLPQETNQIDPEEDVDDEGGDASDEEVEDGSEDEEDDGDALCWREEIDADIDERMEVEGIAGLRKRKVDNAPDKLAADGGDKVSSMDLDELLDLLSPRDDQRQPLLRRVQSEIREELNSRKYHYIEGEMTQYSKGPKNAGAAFFVPSTGSHASHFDLSIILEDRPHCCVRFNVTFPILCGPEMAPALLTRFAELNQSMRYFSWNYDAKDHAITLRETVPFWEGDLSRNVLTHLMDCMLYLPLMTFPELEWLSTGIITAKVAAKQLEEMQKFLQRLEKNGPCLSPRALQLLRDG